MRAGGLSLAGAIPAAVWEKAAEKGSTGRMPPLGALRPEANEKAVFVARVEKTYGRAASGDPGRVTTRRLNRDEYNNTVRDLLAARRAEDAKRVPSA